ncbi:MAG: HIT family protein [Chthonomonas sp.]|nr:HIT family protein [Chthonomonas sp.]
MAQHQDSCDVCRQLALAEAGEHPRFVANLSQSVVVMGPHQVWPGYTMLLVRQPVTELDELSEPDYLELMSELRRVAKAVREVTNADKLNYEALGNQCHHLHWHIFPRQANEPRRLEPVWTSFPENMADYRYDAEKHDQIRAAFTSRLL